MRRSTRLASAPRSSLQARKIKHGPSRAASGQNSPPQDDIKAETLPHDSENQQSIDAPKKESRLADKKFQAWSAHATTSPFPEFPRPTPKECEKANSILHEMHHLDVEKEFSDPNTPETIPHVLDAMVVAVLSAATSWNNAKRAMNSMRGEYGSIFAYPDIFEGGKAKLEETIRCGGLHIRKSNIIMNMLEEVQKRHGKWDMDYLFNVSDEDAMQELMHYKGMGPKCASVVMNWCLKRNAFTVDTHIYRIAGLWKWIPDGVSRELAQSHLDARVPVSVKQSIHFLLIAHGRTCPACRAPSTKGAKCIARSKIKADDE
ncbi:uncharacterized protein RCC_12048 [Ramularia collo-cygni]|uniref:HhH-GPD domain-containing protein n=1 Tax=Ramularia collo-cygni TaxID=112498 RepID=A0A2D3UQ48_9PEZI|nr:uncharacterized protein RCC_12048 [Ramularia collo-cygni]CZT15225.1 uncharacterized protein RCC_12048 [Ramularia collo-cygni]